MFVAVEQFAPSRWTATTKFHALPFISTMSMTVHSHLHRKGSPRYQ